MVSLLEFKKLTSDAYATSLCDRDQCIRKSPVYNWLLYGKLPIDEYVTPGYREKIVTAHMKNRYLREVHVKKIPTFVSDITMPLDATSTMSFDNLGTASSDDIGVLLPVVNAGSVVMRAMSNGTAKVTVKDVNGDLIATITVNVA